MFLCVGHAHEYFSERDSSSSCDVRGGENYAFLESSNLSEDTSNLPQHLSSCEVCGEIRTDTNVACASVDCTRQLYFNLHFSYIHLELSMLAVIRLGVRVAVGETD